MIDVRAEAELSEQERGKGHDEEPLEDVGRRPPAREQGQPGGQHEHRRHALSESPGPRRFAQGMAAVFMLAAGLTLLPGWRTASYVFQGLLVVAFAALLLGKFCLGAYVYHLLKGNVALANGTCPWSDSA